MASASQADRRPGTETATRQDAPQKSRAALLRWMAQRLAGLRARSSILEVGCGDAAFTKELVRYSPDVAAIDVSESRIQENARRFGGVTFLQHDVAERFPFEMGAFDVIWCADVLAELYDPVFALREMHRILKPGGKLLVTVPYHGRLKNVLIALFKFESHFAPTNPHFRYYTRQSLRQLTDASGFGEIRFETCGESPLQDLLLPTELLMSATRGPQRD